jgi:hypothetical protein
VSSNRATPIPIRPSSIPIDEEPAAPEIANTIAGLSRQLLGIHKELTSIKEVIVALALRNSLRQ